MASEFAQNFVKGLAVSRPASPPHSNPYDADESDASSSQPPSPTVLGIRPPNTVSPRKPALHALLVNLNQQPPITPSDVASYTKKFKEVLLGRHDDEGIKARVPRSWQAVADSEEDTMREGVLRTLVLALYSSALEIHLTQAVELEAEAEWWRDVESSNVSTLWYLIQTCPRRLLNVFHVVWKQCGYRGVGLQTFTLSNSPLPRFPTPQFSLKPGAILTALFPYLAEQNDQQTLSVALLLPGPPNSLAPDGKSKPTPIHRIRGWLSTFWKLVLLPLELTRQECHHKRRALERLRDERATTLGYLASIRGTLDFSLQQQQPQSSDLRRRKYTTFLDTLIRIVTPATSSTAYEDTDPLSLLTRLSTISLPSLSLTHTRALTQFQLLRPSTLALLWPQLVFLPPLALYVYTSRGEWVPKLVQLGQESGETISRFVEDWLVRPVSDVIKTVRGDPEVVGRMRIVTQEAVESDLESLQRMARSLASDYLSYDQASLNKLDQSIEQGDMTPIMQLYESDMRRLTRSLLDGRLMRGILVQVQKAKVDINYALRGIDHLLKSQELTFAFVGLSPALLVVYLVAGMAQRVWVGGRAGGRFGGKSRRRAAWNGIRRIEKILLLQPSTPSGASIPVAPPSATPSRPISAFSASTFSLSSPPPPAGPTLNVSYVSTPGSTPMGPILPEPTPVIDTDLTLPIAPLPTGLLLLSLLRLRAWAVRHLPVHIREPFLEDLEMIEDPRLGRDEKLGGVSRVWRVWDEEMRRI